MDNEALTVNTAATNTGQPLVFQSPPVLAPVIHPAEQAAIDGQAQTHARNLSSRAATLAGAIGGVLVGMVAVGKQHTHRIWKIVGIGAVGAIVGRVISNMPWASKQPPAMPENQPNPVSLPNVPRVPTPTPPSHPATPATTVSESLADGRVEAAAQAQQIGA